MKPSVKPQKKAVVLMNLGGPTDLQSVRPFLFNLFYDKAILRLPNPLRWFLAWLISKRRTGEATEIYEKLGGKSPLLEETQKQARGLEKALGEGYKVFIAMRYWKPFSSQTVQELLAYDPSDILLLPLYPQFSTTTSQSSIEEFQRCLKKAGCYKPTALLPCFFYDASFISVMAEGVCLEYDRAKHHGVPRILWTAHGLPKKIIKEGDPYQRHVEETVTYLEKKLQGIGAFESVTCYQSRVGPLEWIGPYADDEIKRAGQDKAPLIVVPIAFVSEHSETLVELDMEYRELAEEVGVPFYGRVSTVRDAKDFLSGLAQLIQGTPVEKVPSCPFCRKNPELGCSNYLQVYK